MKKRVLILSGVVPATNRGGGCMALHRHFVEREDFEVAVAGACLNGTSVKPNVSLAPGRITQRLMRTPLCRFIENAQYLSSWYRTPRKLERFISSWQPDMIFTVADNLHLGWAWRASRRFRIPLVVNFQDLYPLSNYIATKSRPYAPVSAFLLRRYAAVNREADTVFYTSEGMAEWFGGSPRGRVLYPIGADLTICSGSSLPSRRPIRLLYAGNCLAAYGRMLLQLANELDGNPDIQLRIFTAGNDWSADDKRRFSEGGILQGFRQFEELQREMADADAFLTLMSFEKEERPQVQTSFTTKWLDYVPFGKPVFVWGPEYSSAVVFGRKHSCASVVTSPDPGQLCSAVKELILNEQEWHDFSTSSTQLAERLLNPREIHGVLKFEMTAIGQQNGNSSQYYSAATKNETPVSTTP